MFDRIYDDKNKALVKDALEELESSHRDAILVLFEKDFDAYSLFVCYTSAFPHTIIVTRPGFAPSANQTLPPFSAEKREISIFEQSGIRTVYLLEKIIEEAATKKKTLTLEIYKLLKEHSITSSVRERIFKKHVHHL
jgi:hypothetical protein